MAVAFLQNILHKFLFDNAQLKRSKWPENNLYSKREELFIREAQASRRDEEGKWRMICCQGTSVRLKDALVVHLRQRLKKKDELIKSLTQCVEDLQGKIDLYNGEYSLNKSPCSNKTGRNSKFVAQSSQYGLYTIHEDCSELSREELESSYKNLSSRYKKLRRTNRLSHCTFPSNSSKSDSPSQACKNFQKSNAVDVRNRPNHSNMPCCLQEKLQLSNCIKSLTDRLDHTDIHNERLEIELLEAKERNELLEFRVLEIENDALANDFRLCHCDSKRSNCDRSISTMDDEGFTSSCGDTSSDSEPDDNKKKQEKIHA